MDMSFTNIMLIAGAAALCANGLVFAVHAFLGAIKDMTVSTVDDRAYNALGKVLGVMQKILEFFGAIKAPATPKPV